MLCYDAHLQIMARATTQACIPCRAADHRLNFQKKIHNWLSKASLACNMLDGYHSESHIMSRHFQKKLNTNDLWPLQPTVDGHIMPRCGCVVSGYPPFNSTHVHV